MNVSRPRFVSPIALIYWNLFCMSSPSYLFFFFKKKIGEHTTSPFKGFHTGPKKSFSKHLKNPQLSKQNKTKQKKERNGNRSLGRRRSRLF